jgi:membrane protein implicated in regulation of membrane protease activity
MNGRQPALRLSGRPVAHFLSMIVLGVVLVGAVIMGAFALVALLALFVVAYAVFSARVWWRLLKLRGGNPFNSAPEAGSDKNARYIEGEYEVVEAEADARRRNSGTR